MLLSLLYRLVRCLLGLLAVLVRPDLSMDVELLVLRYENQELRPGCHLPPRLWSDRAGTELTAYQALLAGPLIV